MALSAGICLLDKINRSKKKEFGFKKFPQISNLYLGPSNFYTDEKILKKLNKKKFHIYEKFTISQVAKSLSQGKIIARCAGRMEFGQRALENRSILRSRFRNKKKINSAIKNRDFGCHFRQPILKNLVTNI